MMVILIGVYRLALFDFTDIGGVEENGSDHGEKIPGKMNRNKPSKSRRRNENSDSAEDKTIS